MIDALGRFLKMKIRADETSVQDLFNRPNLAFTVPVYQRGYAWGQDQWTDVWDDVNSLGKDDSHFIGSIVVVSQGAVAKGFDEIEVVDGQQRLATISILLCALRDSYKARNEQGKSASINRLYLYSETFNAQDIKLSLGKADNEAYQRLIGGRPLPGHRVTEAYNFFAQRLLAEQDLDQVSTRFTKGVRLVFISTESEEDAFTLFETLNDRGLELSAVDLIKNYILRAAAKKHGKVEAMADSWEGIRESLEDLDNIRFFRQFLLANYPGKVTKSGLYHQYKKLISDGSDLEDFVERLGDAADYYDNIHSKGFSDAALNYKLEDLLNLKATTSFTLLLRLLADEWPASKILSVIPAIEAFSIRRAMSGLSTSEMDTIYNQIANLPDLERSPRKIYELLAANCPADQEFYQKFLTSNFRQDSQTKYILEQFEQQLVMTGEKRIADRQHVHIEHIMPQTIDTKKSFRTQGGDWVTYLAADAAKHAEYYQRIGNLTLLGAELNVPASNNPFSAKKKFYERSEIRLTKELCEFEEWRIAQIEERSKRMAEEATRIWRIDSNAAPGI
jgi:Protein of unknown function DUF262/Protein of unknown function (DUF1524)